jgi:hypothetical protein
MNCRKCGGNNVHRTTRHHTVCGDCGFVVKSELPIERSVYPLDVTSPGPDQKLETKRVEGECLNGGS